MQDRAAELDSLKKQNQDLIHQLADEKKDDGCPAIGNEKSEYACCDCPMYDACTWTSKISYLPK